MKKQYILGFLVLMGLGVVSTMAFTFDDGTITAPETIVSGAQLEGDITDLKILPGKLDGSVVYFKVTIGNNGDEDWTLQMLDGSGNMLDVTADGGEWGDTDGTAFNIEFKEPGDAFADPTTESLSLGEGYVEFTTDGLTGTTVWIKLSGDKTDAGALDGLYHEIGSIIISAADTS